MYKYMFLGNKNIVEQLSECLKNGTLPHGVIFSGPQHIGKRTLALCVAKYILTKESIPFIKYIDKEGDIREEELLNNSSFSTVAVKEDKKNIDIKQIQDLRKKLSLTQEGTKVILIDDAQFLSAEATSALLKTLEEPQGKSLFIFIVSDESLLFDTIRSRCILFSFSLGEKKDIARFFEKEGIKKDEKLIEYALLRPGLARQLIIDKDLVLWFDDALDILGKIKDIPIYRRFLYMDKLNEDGKFSLFAECAIFWFSDVVGKIEGVQNAYFSSRQKDLEKAVVSYNLKSASLIIKKIIDTNYMTARFNLNQNLAVEAFSLSL